MHFENLDLLKDANQEKLNNINSWFDKYKKSEMLKYFEMIALLTKVKLYIINKLNQISSISTFLKTSNGFKITLQEGFVCADRISNNMVKLVDRLEFSRANFSSEFLKGWEK